MSKRKFKILIGSMMCIAILMASLLVSIIIYGIISFKNDEDIIIEECTVESIHSVSTTESNELLTNDSLTAGITASIGSMLNKSNKSTADSFDDKIGNDEISMNGIILTRYSLPSVYYPNIDFQSMQPFMSYKMVTNKATEAYKMCHSELSYIDENGLLRHEVGDDQFSINGQDDYVIALGTYYKERNHCGERFLIITTTGMYTAITGDEKADKHTDSHHMVHDHCDGTYSLIEFIVDTPSLEELVLLTGTLRNSSVEAFQGDILHIYKIIEED